MERKFLYFAYGSNLNTARMFDRCENAQLKSKAILENYRLVFLKNDKERAVANILPAEGKVVHGALYKVSALDVAELDKFEGHPRLYCREWVEVKLKSGATVKAFTYMMVDSDKRQFGTPSRDYFNHLFKGYTQWGLPKASLMNALERVVKVEENPNLHSVFVYGSLLKGFWNHERCLSEVPCKGEAILKGNYDLYHLPVGYPALVEGNKENCIIGEVYSVNSDELARLDMLEGYHKDRPGYSMYRRETVQVELENGKVVNSFVYIYQLKLATGAELVKNGDWREFMREREIPAT
jgi:gamma-glutamylcyclotransferase (GGCT)/AIG2-like uncharacterized protein YtfP